MLTIDQIRRVHVELTTRCNARCPMCVRNYRGYEYNSGYPICELSLQDFKHIFRPEFLAQLNWYDPTAKVRPWQGVTFNGNLGDFASAKDALEIVEYLVQHNVHVKINTNGSVRNPQWWSRLALPNVEVGFALDGLADTHSLYRQDTDWHRIIQHAESLIKAGGSAVWRFIPFDHNRHQESACRELAQQMGFVKFDNIYDGRDNTSVYDRQGNFTHRIGYDPGAVQPRIEGFLQHHLTWYDAKTFRHHKDTAMLDLRCVHKISKEIYVAADGSVYPCCFLGFYPHTMNHPGNRELAPMIFENNALEYSLEHCMRWFDAVEQSWQQHSVAQGRTYQCVASCNRAVN